MTILTREERVLLVEVAFAGVNHGLKKQVSEFLPALQLLVPDEDSRMVCTAFLLSALGETERAIQLLEQCNHSDAPSLKQILTQRAHYEGTLP
jgi:type III secretion system SsaH family protein